MHNFKHCDIHITYTVRVISRSMRTTCVYKIYKRLLIRKGWWWLIVHLSCPSKMLTANESDWSRLTLTTPVVNGFFSLCQQKRYYSLYGALIHVMFTYTHASPQQDSLYSAHGNTDGLFYVSSRKIAISSTLKPQSQRNRCQASPWANLVSSLPSFLPFFLFFLWSRILDPNIEPQTAPYW